MHNPLATALLALAAGCGGEERPPGSTGSDTPTDGAAVPGDYEVLAYYPNRVYGGTTLFTDDSDHTRPRVVEVDMSGQVVWEYVVPPDRLADGAGTLMEAELLPSGNVLLVVNKEGVFEIDRGGEVVWEFGSDQVSHDADRLPNGNTLVALGWTDRGHDQVMEVDPSGAVVWKWDALVPFSGEEWADVEYEGWIHPNSVQRLENGNTLVGLRNFNMVGEVTPQGELAWSYTFASARKPKVKRTEGEVRGERPHDPELTEHGTILVAVRNPDQVYELRPDSGRVVWKWRHPDGPTSFRSIGDANRLPNGNTLIVDKSNLIEVSPRGTIVWQLRAPERLETKVFAKAQRIGEDGSIHGH